MKLDCTNLSIVVFNQVFSLEFLILFSVSRVNSLTPPVWHVHIVIYVNSSSGKFCVWFFVSRSMRFPQSFLFSLSYCLRTMHFLYFPFQKTAHSSSFETSSPESETKSKRSPSPTQEDSPSIEWVNASWSVLLSRVLGECGLIANSYATRLVVTSLIICWLNDHADVA